MRSKRLRFHPEARGDVREALGWYQDRSPAVAAEFRVIVPEVIRSIVQAPQRWPKYLRGTRRFLHHRFPFSVIYLDDPQAVSIVGVAHSKRRPGYWKQRL
jgi:plasmid stabilization system protein ParE